MQSLILVLSTPHITQQITFVISQDVVVGFFAMNLVFPNKSRLDCPDLKLLRSVVGKTFRLCTRGMNLREQCVLCASNLTSNKGGWYFDGMKQFNGARVLIL